ncbi:hypothetical protein NA57DRAFT_56696 [Rhizodiscina lignyota]|uniref:Aminoglycoside phosphotransferase domain-containing protein n=1 Tax=Rhizodiscina lignyota TaxID=1504668 RepID=A0A9P4IG94_9PEZI|nr:hypothetical protein NA57DRAFT_56696 [Rhizodiscina lignyota]
MPLRFLEPDGFVVKKARSLKERFQDATTCLHRDKDEHGCETSSAAGSETGCDPGCGTLLREALRKVDRGARRAVQKLYLKTCGNKKKYEREPEKASLEQLALIRSASSTEVFPSPPSYKSYESSENEEERIWGPILTIPQESFLDLALKHGPIGDFDEDGNFKAVTAQWIKQMSGSNNLVTIIEYSNGKRVAIKVPACGWHNKWMKADQEAMRIQVNTMKYMKEKAGVPIPDIIAWNPTLTSKFGHPYIIMECLEGEPVCWAWFDDSRGHMSLEDKRRNILRSISQNISKLHALSFDKIGSLYFDKEDETPTVGPNIDVWPGMAERSEKYLNQDFDWFLEPPSESSQTFFREQLEGWHQAAIADWPSLESENQMARIHGMYKLFSVILDYFPYSKLTTKHDSGPETFVLTPPDFDWQNIMVDDDGNVTGFIDWDRVSTMPRYLGWAGAPQFLIRNYYHDYEWPRRDGLAALSPAEHTHYQKLYTRYMEDACRNLGDDVQDWKFTSKSHLIDNLAEAIGCDEMMEDTLWKVLDNIAPWCKKWKFIRDIGMCGWADGQEEWCRDGLRKLLAC